jgi:hypothetical protein
VCLIAVFAVPAVALARAFPPDRDYQGRIEGDPNTYFGFDRDKVHGKRVIRHTAVALPMSCHSGDRGIVTARIPGVFRIHRDDYFTISGGDHPHRLRHVRLFFGDGETHTAYGSGSGEVFGELKGKDRSYGVVGIHTRSESFGKCYSGYVSWRAERGAEVDLPAAG